MYRYLLIILLLCSVFSLNGQDQEKIDVLLEQLEASQPDTLRSKILDDLWNLTAYSNPPEAISYAKQAIAFANEMDYKKWEALGYQRLGIAYSNVSDYKNSNKAYRKALGFYKKNDDDYRIGLVHYNLAINFKDQSQYDSTLYYNAIAEKHFKAIGDSLQLANTIGLKGNVYSEKGQMLLALQYTLKEAEMFKQLKDTLRYTDATKSLAKIQESKGDLKQAIKNFHECIRLYKKYNDNYFLCSTYRDLGVTYLNTKPMLGDSAYYYFNQSIAIAQKNTMHYQEAAALSYLGELFVKQDKLQEAEVALKKSRKISQNINNNISEVAALIELSNLYRKQKNNDKALVFAKNALKLANENGLNSSINLAHLSLYEAYRAKSDTQNALFHFEAYKRTGDSLYNIAQSNKINELQIIHETERKETELALQDEEIKALNTQAENDKLTKTIYGVGMLSFLTITGLIYFSFKQRIKKNRIEREKQEAILKQEIEFKKKELTSQTLHLVQKNTFIQELKDNLEKIKNSPELFKVEFRRLVMLLKKESAEDKDWEVFKSYFSQVHNDFDNKIKAIANDITEKEIRLASFIRMNLTTKEIASMLNVLPDSVTKSKYRLKKKLALDKDANLTEFLNTL